MAVKMGRSRQVNIYIHTCVCIYIFMLEVELVESRINDYVKVR